MIRVEVKGLWALTLTHAQIYKHLMAGPLWQRRNGSDFVFFQSHTGFARGPVGGTYEDMLCNEFAPALHFVNVRAQRYKCQARRLHLYYLLHAATGAW